MTAVRDLAFDGRNRKESLKTLAIYHVILPQLFQLVSNGFQWDGEDQKRALKWGNFSAIPIAGDAVEGVINHFSNRGFGYSPTVLTDLYDTSLKGIAEAEELVEAIKQADNMSFEELWGSIDKLSKAAGYWTGTPADFVHNSVSGVADAINGETDFPMRRILGWSEFALDNDRYDLLRDMHADARKLIKDNLNNEEKFFDELLEGMCDPESFDDLVED